MVISVSIHFKEQKREKLTVEYLNRFEKNDDKDTFYRGQTNIKWVISPSITRNLDKSTVIDYDYLSYISEQYGLEGKFDTLIKSKTTRNFNEYEKWAFFQHSVSFSPLIDFTKDGIIATSFALMNSSEKNNFNLVDSVVYKVTRLSQASEFSDLISNIKDASDFIEHRFNLTYLNEDKISLGKVYSIKKTNGSESIFDCTDIKIIIDSLIPHYIFIDCPTNDRMIYQKGCFLLVSDCVMLKNKIFYELNNDILFERIPIRNKDKAKILEHIFKNYRNYDIQHLYDPYLAFKE